MKSESSGNLTRFLLSIVCVIGFLFFFGAMIANTLNTNLDDFFLG